MQIKIFVGADLCVCPNAAMARLAKSPSSITERGNGDRIALGRHKGLPLRGHSRAVHHVASGNHGRHKLIHLFFGMNGVDRNSHSGLCNKPDARDPNIMIGQ
jgi:hypothetical protein